MRTTLQGTEPWNAPETKTLAPLPLDVVGLRRTDLYSFGLMVWKVMCNGKDPWTLLCRDGGSVIKASRQTTAGAEGTKLSKEDFKALKTLDDDTLLRLAIETLQEPSPSDVPYDEACRVLKLTLRRSPNNRATGFTKVVHAFKLNRATASLSMWVILQPGLAEYSLINLFPESTTQVQSLCPAETLEHHLSRSSHLPQLARTLCLLINL